MKLCIKSVYALIDLDPVISNLGIYHKEIILYINTHTHTHTHTHQDVYTRLFAILIKIVNF